MAQRSDEQVRRAAVAEALGERRFQRMDEAVGRLLQQADAAPDFTESFTNLIIPLKSADAAAVSREIRDRVRADPGEEWNYLIFTRPDGSSYARANPWMHRATALDSQEWIASFTMSELFVRLSGWWLTQMWRAAELAAGAREALDEWSILVAAACARSLLEGAAYFRHELPILIELWDGFKKQGTPTIDRIDGFIRQLNLHVTTLQYATRLGEVRTSHPQMLSKNVMTYIEKAAKGSPSVDVLGMYEWLCDAVHPSFGSTTVYRALALGDDARTHILERYERRPLELIVATPKRVQPTIAQKAADATVFSADLLRQDLARARWVIEDIGLTVDVKASIGLNATLAHAHPERNQQCPCGSGRKFKKCVHRWGDAGTPLLFDGVSGQRSE